MSHSKHLDTLGYTVVPVVPSYSLDMVYKRFIKAILSAPEMMKLPKVLRKRLQMQDPTLNKNDFSFVGGAYGALGNSSSFHHPTIRKLRAFVSSILLERVFGEYLKDDPDVNYQAVIDRVMVRLAGGNIGRESLHRDVDPSSVSDSTIKGVYGGWLNLSYRHDTFFCIPGTHKDHCTGKGFFKIPKSELPKYKDKCIAVNIPPGHCIVFNERILHEINPSKSAKYRMFLGHRLTVGPRSIDPKTLRAIRTMAPVALKSGQDSRMWPVLWWTNWRNKLPIQADTLINPSVWDGCTETRTVQRGPDEGSKYRCIKPVMPSLLSLYGKLPFTEYCSDELGLYRASRTFKVNVAGKYICNLAYN